jgi:hypothetical protein
VVVVNAGVGTVVSRDVGCVDVRTTVVATVVVSSVVVVVGTVGCVDDLRTGDVVRVGSGHNAVIANDD